MKIGYLLLATSLLPAMCVAQTPILSSLEAKGIKVTVLDDESLGKIRGAARITGHPYPSVTQGMKTYNIRLKRFGNEHDYRSYYSIGSAWDPHGKYEHTENGVTYKVAGDRWLADKSPYRLFPGNQPISQSTQESRKHEYQQTFHATNV